MPESVVFYWHRLTVTGRVNRILTIVPDALVVQWFVALARRFNLRCRIFDDVFVAAQPPSTAGDNLLLVPIINMRIRSANLSKHPGG